MRYTQVVRPTKLHVLFGVSVVLAGACAIERIGSGPPFSGAVDGGGDVVTVIPDTGTKDTFVPPTDSGQDVVTIVDAGPDGIAVPPGFPFGVVLADASSAVNLSGLTEINTDTLTTTPASTASFTRVAPAAVTGASSLQLAVLIVNNLNVDTPLRISGTYPLVIVAAGNVTVSAAINAAATDLAPGPGGGWNKGGFPAIGVDGGGIRDGVGSIGTGAEPKGGGGGAGHFSAGAKGGSNGGNGGSAYTGISNILFKGGSPGGNGTFQDVVGLCGYGGSGGGAVQISVYGKLTLEAGGAIGVGGGGGQGGCGDNSGAGGGSGGVIVLESLGPLGVEGSLAANGGGGGGGSTLSTAGNAGAAGALGTTPAAGGIGTPPDPMDAGTATGDANAPSGAGGKGGAGAVNPTVGVSSGSRGGGGGGAYGQIFFRYRPGSLTVKGTAVLSPGNKDFTL